MNDSQHYTVCTRCFTYNHEAYISDALIGFVTQELKFPVVFVIVDDASTDKTPGIIQNFYRENFEWENKDIALEEENHYGTVLYAQHRINRNCYFSVLLLKENHYRQKKSKMVYLSRWIIESDYCAICEGDDYWIDSQKLDKQVSILEKEHDLMAVVTNTRIVDREGITLSERFSNIVPDNIQGRYDLHDYFKNVHHYPTATVLYRNVFRDEIEAKQQHTLNQYLGDWTLWAILHSYGDFYYLDTVTSAYRVNPTSLTHTVDRIGRAKANITICKSLSEVLPLEYAHYLKTDGWMFFSIFMAYRKEKKWFMMIVYFSICLFRYPIYTMKKLLQLLKGLSD